MTAKDAKVYVAGHQGLVGSAVVRLLKKQGYPDPLVRTREELDLRDQVGVRRLLETERPRLVFLCAARVGGIQANASCPAQFIHDNLQLQTNVIHEAWRCGVERLVFLASSCSYPRDCPQPMKEEHLLTGPVEPTSRPYSVAKIAGVEMCWAYNRQYGTRFVAALPNTVYGPGDDFDLATCHVLPALIRRMHEAQERGLESVTLWGTGSPRREHLYCDDVAGALLFLMTLPRSRLDELLADTGGPPLFNVGCGEDHSIAELAAIIAEVVGYTGELRWDTSKPDGAPQKLLDNRRLAALSWSASTPLRDGVARAYEHFLRQGWENSVSGANSTRSK